MRKGFTLIELLVVISILGLMASIALAGLNSARDNAKDTAIKSSLTQLRTLLAQEYADTGSYTGLTPAGINGWIYPDCATVAFSSTNAGYVSKAREICASLAKIYIAGGGSCFVIVSPPPIYCLYMGQANVVSPLSYSIMAWLPGKETYVCIGSSGKTSQTENSLAFDDPGCKANP